MYRVTVVTDGKEYPLLNKYLKLQSPSLKEVAGNSPAYLKFAIPPEHPNHDKIDCLRSELFVYEDGEEIFRGRSITTQENFYRTNSMTCESDLAYLCDSIMRPYEFQGSIMEFLKIVINNHNSQVEARKRFVVGKVNVVDNNNYINRSNSDYSNSLDCLRNKLVETHGGYLRTRCENNVRYLDYVTDAGGTNKQIIRYGVNLANYEKNRDATTLFTALIPTGADLEITLPDGNLGTETVTISSVNDGNDYIYDQEAVNRYGWIFRQVKWEDVTLPENLLAKAKAYLAKSIYLSDVLNLTAIDLADMGVSIDRLKTGFWTRVKSKQHGIDVVYLLEERTRYLQEPGKGSISLGGTIATLSGSTAKNQSELNAYIQQVAQSASHEINRKVENATELITGGLGGYIVIGRAADGHPEEFLVMDAPTKEAATNVIRLNKNGLGFSTTGYNGVYRNAWTIDGNLVADFITTGTMLADRVRGGTLEIGGVGLGKDGQIIIYDASGKVVALLDKNGVDVRKGSIKGADLTLGGTNNADGTMKILDASGNVVASADNNGMNIYRGMFASYAQNGNDRATVTDGSFKVWKGSQESPIAYMGDGGWEGLGSAGSAIIILHGLNGIILDASDGSISGQGNIIAGKKVIAADGMECNKNMDCYGTGIFHENVEISGDVFNSGTSFSSLVDRVTALESKIGGE